MWEFCPAPVLIQTRMKARLSAEAALEAQDTSFIRETTQLGPDEMEWYKVAVAQETKRRDAFKEHRWRLIFAIALIVIALFAILGLSHILSA